VEPCHGISFLNRKRRIPTLGAAALLLALGATAVSKTYESRDAALVRVFGAEARVERRTLFLSAAQRDSAVARGAALIAQVRVTFYEGWRGDSLLGRAYLDTHRVRNEEETVLVVVDPEGRSRHVDILAFHRYCGRTGKMAPVSRFGPPDRPLEARRQ